MNVPTINLNEAVQGTTAQRNPTDPTPAMVAAGGVETLVASVIVEGMDAVMIIGTPSGTLSGVRIAISAMSGGTGCAELTVLQAPLPYGGYRVPLAKELVLWATDNWTQPAISTPFGIGLDVSTAAVVSVYATSNSGCPVTVDACAQRPVAA